MTNSNDTHDNNNSNETAGSAVQVIDPENYVTVYIDDVPYQVSKQNNLLAGVLSQKLNLPYFCWHPAMGSVGACRQCAVSQYQDENDTRGRMVMACMTPVTDGMRIGLKDHSSVEFREQVIGAMMTNHPHDCPVCSEGGECHLQDMTLMTGHHSRSYSGLKRTFSNQNLGPLVGHEMNRCITCYRCVRFYKDYAGGKDFGVFGSRNQVYFGRQQDGVLESEFSGNLVEVCPTGVFTNKVFSEHYTRKWDLQSAPSVCAHCAVGCNTSIGERYGSVRRVVNRFNSELNGYFLCDRGRFGIGFVNGEQRLSACTGIKQASADKLTRLDVAKTLAHFKGKQFIGIGSMRASLEANFYLQQLVGKGHFSAGLSGADMALAGQHLSLLHQYPAPGLSAVEQSDFVLILGEDLTQSSPRMALAVRQALQNASIDKAAKLGLVPWQDDAVRNVGGSLRTPLYCLHSVPTKLDDECREHRLLAPSDIEDWLNAFNKSLRLKLTSADGEPLTVAELTQLSGLSEQQAGFFKPLLKSLLAAKKPLVIGGWSLACANLLRGINQLMTHLHSDEFKNQTKDSFAKVVIMPGQCNSVGLLSLLDEQSLSIEHVFDLLNEQKPQARAQIAGVIVLENELSDLSTQQLKRLRQLAATVIVLDHSQTDLSEMADIVMPVAAVSEGEGHYVNYQGQAQGYYQVHAPLLPRQDSWRWLNLVGQSLLDQESLDSLPALHQYLGEQYQGWPLSGLTGQLPTTEQVPATAQMTSTDRVARQTHRASGRTAQMASISVHEAKTTQSAASPLSYSMEGQSLAASANMPFSWAPGWNSNHAIAQFQTQVGGDLKRQGNALRLTFSDPLNLIEKYPSPIGNAINSRQQQTGTELCFVPQTSWYRGDWQANFTPEFTLLHSGNRIYIARAYAQAQGWQQDQYLLIDSSQTGLSTLAQVSLVEQARGHYVYGYLFELGASTSKISYFPVRLSAADTQQIAQHQRFENNRIEQAKASKDKTLERLKARDQTIPIRFVCGGLDDV